MSDGSEDGGSQNPILPPWRIKQLECEERERLEWERMMSATPRNRF